MSSNEAAEGESSMPSDVERWKFEVNWRRQFMLMADRQNLMLERIALALENIAGKYRP